MARPELEVVLKAKDELGRVLDQTNTRIQNMSHGMKIAGGIMTGAGIAIVGALGLAVKAAAEEEAGINRLRVAMQNVGLSYDDNRESLEALIDATQQKTAVGDTEQRASLSSLILMTKDLNKALDLNAVAMDVAAGTGKDLASVTTLIGYALSGNWGMVTRMIPALKAASTEEERWIMLRQMFAGQAEAYGKTVAGQFELLQHNIGDLKEAIGSVLLPVVSQITEKVQNFVRWLKELDPKVVDIGVKVALLGGAFALVGGPMLIVVSMLPKLITGFVAVKGAVMSASSMMLRYVAPLLAVAYASDQASVAVKNLVAWLSGGILPMEEFRDPYKWAKDQLSGLGRASMELMEGFGGAADSGEDLLQVARDLTAGTEDTATELRQAKDAALEFAGGLDTVAREALDLADAVWGYGYTVKTVTELTQEELDAINFDAALLRLTEFGGAYANVLGAGLPIAELERQWLSLGNAGKTAGDKTRDAWQEALDVIKEFPAQQLGIAWLFAQYGEDQADARKRVAEQARAQIGFTKAVEEAQWELALSLWATGTALEDIAAMGLPIPKPGETWPEAAVGLTPGGGRVLAMATNVAGPTIAFDWEKYIGATEGFTEALSGFGFPESIEVKVYLDSDEIASRVTSNIEQKIGQSTQSRARVEP